MKLFHITAGVLALVFGAVALYAAKGSPMHRRSGAVFVYAMLATCFGGLVMAIGRGVAPALNVPAALLTAYLVMTALTTVRPLATRSHRLARWSDHGAMLVALAVAAASLAFGFEALASVDGKRNGMPAFPFFMFGVVGLLAGIGDLRMIRSDGLRGAPRIARHLWRMCFALFVANISFFVGQARFFPEPMRKSGVLAVPVVLVLVLMLYWLARVLVKRARPAALLRYTGAASPSHEPDAITVLERQAPQA